MSRNALNLNLLNYNMKILQVAFLLLFNYLDSLPKLYYKRNRYGSAGMLENSHQLI